MKNIYFYILFLLIAFCGEVKAQRILNDNILGLSIGPRTQIINNRSISNYHFFNPYYYNPAMAGIEGKKQLNADWNRQTENSFLVSYEQPINAINSAFGIFVSSTSENNISTRNYGLAYNYGFRFKNDAKLNFGFQFSQSHFSLISTSKKRWYSASSIDVGTAFQIKKFRLGVSAQNLFPVTVIPRSAQPYREVINGRRQINISAANTFKLAANWEWSLAFLLRFYQNDIDDNYFYYDDFLNVYDYSSYFSFRKKYFFGTTFRPDYEFSLIGFVGLKIKEKMNLQLSFNSRRDDREDKRFFETLVQYQF